MARIYFDHAATTPPDPAVVETILFALRELPGNPSSIHEEGRRARAAVEQARKQIAHALHASIGEIFFTSGGTEANTMALKRAAFDLGIRRFVSARTEHHCVLHTLSAMERDLGTETVFVRQHPDGHIDLNDLEEILQQGPPTLVSLMHANNEIGTLSDLASLSALCRRYGALFHTDTVQTIGYYPLDLSQLSVDFLSGSAHKFHGPKGVGFLYINQANHLRPLIDGGSQERNMRGGTENVHSILGMAKALELALAEREKREEQIRAVRDALALRLKNVFPEVVFNGDPFGKGHYKILSAAFPPSAKAELLLLNLDIAGVAVSGGSACSSGADAGSHVLDALAKDSPRKTLRFSFSHHNTVEEVDYLIGKLVEILR